LRHIGNNDKNGELGMDALRSAVEFYNNDLNGHFFDNNIISKIKAVRKNEKIVNKCCKDAKNVIQ